MILLGIRTDTSKLYNVHFSHKQINSQQSLIYNSTNLICLSCKLFPPTQNFITREMLFPIQIIIPSALLVLNKLRYKRYELWSYFFSECYTCAKPTFVKLIWGTIHIYQRLKYIGSCSKMIKRGRLLKQGESRVTAQEIYLKVSPACLLSFLELFNKEKENQKLERFWKISEREKKILWCFKSWFWMIAWTLI